MCRIGPARIRALPLSRPVRALNVCGRHERTIGLAGLRGVLPDGITMIPGPGCPVCVCPVCVCPVCMCPEEDILAAIQIAATPGVRLVAFGDMLRVPANVACGEVRPLPGSAAIRDIRQRGQFLLNC